MLAATVSEEVLTLITSTVEVVVGFAVLPAVTTILSPALKTGQPHNGHGNGGARVGGRHGVRLAGLSEGRVRHRVVGGA